MTDEEWMRLAIEAAEAGMAEGQTPFAACVVKENELVCCMHNHVWADFDITAHAEIVAIRESCRKLKTVDLSACTLYSTCEPCPMCFSAAHWARIRRIVFGASIVDAQAAGFHELTVSNRQLKELGGSSVEIAEGVLREECRKLFANWLQIPGRKAY